MTGWTAARLIFIIQPGGFFTGEHFGKDFSKVEQLGMLCDLYQGNIKPNVDDHRTSDHCNTEGENDP